jgi:hypothetical protein
MAFSIYGFAPAASIASFNFTDASAIVGASPEALIKLFVRSGIIPIH